MPRKVLAIDFAFEFTCLCNPDEVFIAIVLSVDELTIRAKTNVLWPAFFSLSLKTANHMTIRCIIQFNSTAMHKIENRTVRAKTVLVFSEV